MFKKKKKKNEPEDMNEVVMMDEPTESDDDDSESTGKKGRSKQKDKKKKKKGKKNKSLLGSLDFSESVLEMTREKLASESGAVRRVNDGYVLIAITDDMLSDYSPKDEAIGSFAKAVKDGAIDTCVLQNDIDNGMLVIIPDEATMERMDEYYFLRSADFKTVFLSDDIEEDDAVRVLPAEISFVELMNMAENNLTYSLTGDDIDIVPRGEDAMAAASTEVTVEDDEPQAESSDASHGGADFSATVEDDEDYGIEDDIFDDISDISDGEFGSDDYSMDVSGEVDNIDSAGSFDSGDCDNFDDFSDFDDEDDYVPPEPKSKEDVQETIIRRFLGEDLGIEVNDELFNVHFNTMAEQIPLFELHDKKHDDSELERTIEKMASAANTKIKRIHEQNINALKEDYFHILSQHRDDIANKLALDSEDNDYGIMMIATKEISEEFLQQKGRYIREKREALEDEYNQDRQAFIDDAISNASTRYDAMHRNTLRRKIDGIEDNFILEVKQAENKKKAEILEARREKAAAMYNTASVRVLQNLSDEFRRMQEEELYLYEEEKEKMEAYLKENFADDVMRAKAIRDELARHNEVDDLKARYDALQEINETRLEEVRKQAKESLNAVSVKHDRIVEELSRDYEAELMKAKKREEAAYDDFRKLQSDYANIEEKKQKEFEHRLAVAQDEINAKNKQIDSLQEELGKRSKLPMIMMIFLALAFLAVGIAVGVIVTPAHAAEAASTSVGIADTQPVVGGSWFSSVLSVFGL